MTEDWTLDDDWYVGTEPEPYVDPYNYILGMDPGGTTGIAMLRINTEDEHAKPELVYLHQIPDGRYGFKRFFDGSTIGDNLTVVSEKWRERNVKGADREPQYIEGGIHMLWNDDNEGLVWQYPDVKDVITDDYLKSQNLWTPGMPHQMDALRHALAYLRNDGHPGTLDTMNPEGSGDTIAQPGEAERSQLAEDADATGEGEGDAPSFEQTMDALEAMAIAVAEARADIEAFADAMGEVGKLVEQEEPSYDETPGHQHGGPTAYVEPEPETFVRTKRQRNGAFAGYNPEDYDSGSTTLLDD